MDKQVSLFDKQVSLFEIADRNREIPVEAVRAIEQAIRGTPERPRIADLNVTLTERRKIHGDFANDAQISQRLKSVMRDTVNWDDLIDMQHEALEHIATRIARILSGAPNHPDHWHDIQGFAHLVEERLA